MSKQENLKAPINLRPASHEEAGLFYSLPPEQDEAMGTIGHIRIDFGRSGSEFWHTWHPHACEAWNTPEFKADLKEVVDEMRKTALKDLRSMNTFCYTHGGKIDGGWRQNYGYVAEKDRWSYYLRCSPGQGDYHAYLTCYDKRIQGMYMTGNYGINQKVKDWYALEHPSDELGAEIEDITFYDVADSLNKGLDIYEVLGVADSIVRERVFGRTAEILQVDYDVIFKKWLYEDETPDIQLPESTNQQNMTLGGMTLEK